MPACARKEIVRHGEPAIYHAWSRCVRRAFLLGTDPLTGRDYARLLDWTGRQMRGDKVGAIPAGLAPIMERLRLEAHAVPETVAEFPRRFPRLAGTSDQLFARAAEVGRRWFHGVSHANRVFR